MSQKERKYSMKIRWSTYERKVRETFDKFMDELQIGDTISIYHGKELAIDKAKVTGIITKDCDLGTLNKPNPIPTKHLLLQPMYGKEFDQPIDQEGAKTPWFDGDYIIHRNHIFKTAAN